jgi:NodT family efflux transporter outer membrane factor (OMF) lipoprotein
LPRGNWWTIFNDQELSLLEARLEANNPDLVAALAHYEQARAIDAEARSGLFPSISGLFNPTRDRQSDTRPLRGANEPNEYDSDTLGLQEYYELDLWGRVRNQVSAAHSESEASAADLASAQLSLEARLADDYVSLLGQDREIRLLLDTMGAYEKALTLTQTLHDGGVVSGLDVSRAQTQLDAAKAQISEVRAQRALLQHAIAALIGDPGLDLPAYPHEVTLPEIPAGLPSDLLQRRPDIAAAERRTAAANASIGVAKAAFFPSIDLGASVGYQSTGTGSLLGAPSAYWSIGPNVVQTIFDAGLHKARLKHAREVFDEAGAHYRSVVLEAFRQVQDNLALLANYKVEYVDQGAAAKAAEQTLALSMEQYRDGAVDYLNVVDSQAAALSAERAQLQLETRQVRASIDLIRALGGGWSSPDAGAKPVTGSAAAPG